LSPKIWSAALLLILASSAFAVVQGAKICHHCIVPGSDQERLDYIGKARALLDIQRDGRTLLQGPKIEKFDLSPNQQVTCDFIEPDSEDPPNGMSPKLKCDADINGVKVKVKVKYQNPILRDGLSIEPNDGIWGEMLSGRLLWALGFKTNYYFPVQLICRNCPTAPWRYTRLKLQLDGPVTNPEDQAFLSAPRVTLEIPDAEIVIKHDDTDIERTPHQGWSWDEFDVLTATDERGAQLRAERDALALIAAFIQHFDNKPEQQALVCLHNAGTKHHPHCTEAMLELYDLGLTFGYGFVAVPDNLSGPDKARAKNEIRHYTQTSLRGFLAAPVWSDPKNCVTHIRYYQPGGSPANKKISEAGRQLLLSRLKTLSDDDLKDLFTAGRVERRGEMIPDENGNGQRPVTISDWVKGFRTKLKQISEVKCL